MANVWPILTFDPSSTNTLTTLPDFSDESLILVEVQNPFTEKSKEISVLTVSFLRRHSHFFELQ
jgi:hypothetical protein